MTPRNNDEHGDYTGSKETTNNLRTDTMKNDDNIVSSSTLNSVPQASHFCPPPPIPPSRKLQERGKERRKIQRTRTSDYFDTNKDNDDDDDDVFFPNSNVNRSLHSSTNGPNDRKVLRSRSAHGITPLQQMKPNITTSKLVSNSSSDKLRSLTTASSSPNTSNTTSISNNNKDDNNNSSSSPKTRGVKRHPSSSSNKITIEWFFQRKNQQNGNFSRNLATWIITCSASNKLNKVQFVCALCIAMLSITFFITNSNMIESTIAMTSSPENSSKSLLSSQFIVKPSKSKEEADDRTLRGERKKLVTSLLNLKQVDNEQQQTNDKEKNKKEERQRNEVSVTAHDDEKVDKVAIVSSEAVPSKIKYKALSISSVTKDSLERKTDPAPRSSSKFAYAYLLGGCNPSNPAYRGVLYNIMISTYLQRQKGSVADVVVLLQMSSTTDDEQLPQSETDLLNKMNILVEYLPKNSKNEDFVRFNLEKFRVLNMTQYDRVLYLDSDMMVMDNMDYMFELTTNGTLQENVIVSQRKIPAYGGFFVVKPNADGYAEVARLIRQRDRDEQNGVVWDIEKGWGHIIDKDDKYDLASGKKNNLWDYIEAQGDPGLLFHYTKYVAKLVSIFAKDVIQNWHPDDNSNDKIPVTHSKSTDLIITDIFTLRQFCWNQTVYHKRCIQPFSDYVHFPSVSKPWLHNPPPDLSDKTIYNSAGHYWFHSLQQLNKVYDMGINFDDEWNLAIRPLLGLFAKWTPIGAKPTRVASTEVVAAKVVETKAEVTITSEQESAQQSEVQTTEPIVNLRVPYNYSYWQTKPSARFAYAYVVGGCDPNNPAYRNYIYDIMISTYNQRIENSQADVIILFQMLYKSKYDSLPQEDIKMLEAMNIKYMYIPKSSIESFYRIMLDKFRILNLTQYERVFFMDSDVMALGNMDYAFELSMKGVLKKNLIFAGVKEPANGGTFMLAPNEGSWKRIIDIIHNKEQRGLKMPYPHWDNYIGWGHHIDNKTDYYQFVGGKKGRLWDFYGAFADQGLLFHWVKYEEKSVSIIFKEDIQNWDIGPDGTVQLQATIGIDTIPDVYTSNRHCWHDLMNHKPCTTPHSDFIHFTGQRKPWLAGPPSNFGKANSTDSPDHYWYHILSILNQDLNMGIDFTKWKTRMRPALGFYPKLVDAAGTEYKKTLEKRL